MRLDYVDKRAGLAGKRVLDVGCGGGLLSEAMARRGAQCTASTSDCIRSKSPSCMRSIASLPVSTRASPPRGMRSQCWRVRRGDCMEMLEHVPNRKRRCARCALVKPGGHVFVSTLNRNLKSYLLAIVGAEYVMNLLTRGTHTYERFIKPSELAPWARAAQLTRRGHRRPRLRPVSSNSARAIGQRGRELHDASAATRRDRE